MDNMKATLELGTKPVGRLLWQYALPAIVAMTASSLYNIIDRAMIGQVVGPEAIAGLGVYESERGLWCCRWRGRLDVHQREVRTERL